MFRFSAIEGFLRALNKKLERFMPILTPSGVILGLLLAHFFKPYKPAVSWLFAFMTLVNGMGVSVSDFAHVIKKPKPILVFMLNTYILIPLVATAAANLLFRGNADAILGFILLYSIPTAVVACVWSGIYEGNQALSLTLLVIGTALSPLMTPLTIKAASSSDITMDVTGMVTSLIWMVVLPSILGIIINMLTRGRCTEHAVPCLKPFSKIGLLFVIIINVSQVAEDLIETMSLEYVPQFIFAGLFTVLGFIIAKAVSALFRLRRDDTISVTFASGMKNISAAMVIAIEFFPPHSVIPVISGIVLQQTMCALTAHFLFGKKPSDKKTVQKEIRYENDYGNRSENKTSG